MLMQEVLSAKNELVKRTASYKDSKFRKKDKRFLVEGINLVNSIPDGYKVCYVFIDREKHDARRFSWSKCWATYPTNEIVIDKISDTKESQGVVAVLEYPENVKTDENANSLILDNISDAGNMGTIMRTAAAFGYKNIYLIGGVDPYSPKCVRASMGGVFFLNIIQADYETVVKLKESGYEIFAGDMSGTDFDKVNYSGKTAIIIGNEAHGIDDTLKNFADKVVSVPIINVESLNAGVAAAILMHKFKK